MTAIRFKTVVFDLDGTLADTAPDLTAALNHALGELGRPPVPAEDVRHMVGHAPANCYPGSGFEIARTTDRDWRVGPLDIRGIEYVVQRPLADGRVERLNVSSFFIFPDGTFGATLADVDRAAADYRRIKYGVTQVQLVTAGQGLTERQRDEIFRTIVGSESSLEMIRVLRTGIPQ